MNKKYTYDNGFSTGESIANTNIYDNLNPENYTQDDIDNFISAMSEHESEIYRQYSPFEFFASELSRQDNADSLWEGYESGVYEGIKRVCKEFKRDNRRGFKKISE